MRNKALDADCIFEKKKWISITGLCNNNCMFCLDGKRADKFHKSPDEIKKEIKKAREEGNTKLILSGGDPTIHPDIIDFVKYAKELGYKKIQVVTNGRMFASKDFTNKIIEAGLDEVTFSIHGCNSKMHDFLTRVPGSFRQTIKGVKNVFANPKKMIVNTDTCITKYNYKFLPKIIRFIVEKAGITEVNLMSMVPQGNAWKYKDLIMYDYAKVASYVHKVIDYCASKGIYLWLSRFPAEYLEGYEDFIEDPYKKVDDVRGRIGMLKDSVRPVCKGDKCLYCCIKGICSDLCKINLPNLEKAKSQETEFAEEIEVTKDNYKSIGEIAHKNKKILLRIAEPKKRLSEYKKIAPSMTEILQFLKNADLPNIKIDGIPYCMLLKAGIKNIVPVDCRKIDYSKYRKGGKKDYLGLAEELARKSKTKKAACKECVLFETCAGVYVNYARIFGFKEISPIKTKEISAVSNKQKGTPAGKKINDVDINLGKVCNNDCKFCMSKSPKKIPRFAEYITLKEDIIDAALKDYKRITFLGGEPTIHPKILDLVRLARINSFREIHIVSNGRKYCDADFLNKIVKAGATRFSVSIHSHKKEIEDFLTSRKGAFDEKIQGLKNLVSLKRNNSLISQICVNIVVNKKNYPDLCETINFFKERGIRDFRINSMISHSGNAKINKKSLLPKYSEVASYVAKALEIKSINLVIGDFPPCIFKGGVPISKHLKRMGEYSSDCTTTNITYNINQREEKKEKFSWQERKKNTLKTTLENCKKCNFYKRCEGIWNGYVEMYGTEEFVPLK